MANRSWIDDENDQALENHNREYPFRIISTFLHLKHNFMNENILLVYDKF